MLTNLVHAALQSAEGINAFGLFSLVVFFSFFTGVLCWAFRLKKNYLNHMGDLPLDGSETSRPATAKIPTPEL